jgi:hypothetical protein
VANRSTIADTHDFAWAWLTPCDVMGCTPVGHLDLERARSITRTSAFARLPKLSQQGVSEALGVQRRDVGV